MTVSPQDVDSTRETASLAKACNARLKLRDFPAALEIAEKIASIAPTVLQAQLRVAAILMQAGRATEAAARLRDAARVWPDVARIQTALSRALLRIGDVDGGVAAATLAASMEPNAASSHEQLAMALMKAERNEEAVQALDRAAVLDPESASVHATRCRLLLQLGREEEARAAGLRSLELNADQPLVSRLLRGIILPGEERPVETKTSLDGKDGFLFHEVDSAFEQMCGPPVDPNDVAALARILRTRGAWCAERRMTYRMLIVPERHVLYDDKLPDGYTAQPQRMATRLVEALAADAPELVVYPFRAMRDARTQHETCMRQDVHWSSYGAYLGYRALVGSVPDLAGECVPEAALTTRTVARVGDMAMWRGLRTRETCDVLLPPKVALREVMSTKTFATGQVDVLETDNRSGRKLVLFRTSNSTALMPFLAHHFTRIVTLAAVSVAFDLLESERPDFVFSELPERYLAIPAKPGSTPGIRLPRDADGRTFFEQTGCTLPLP